MQLAPLHKASRGRVLQHRWQEDQKFRVTLDYLGSLKLSYREFVSKALKGKVYEPLPHHHRSVGQEDS